MRNLSLRDVEETGEQSLTAKSYSLELSLWIIWDFCLTFRGKSTSESLYEEQIEFLNARCSRGQLRDVAQAWHLLHSFLFPLKGIALASDEIVDVFGGDGEVEAQIGKLLSLQAINNIANNLAEIFTDFFCTAGLDHILILSSYLELQSSEGYENAYHYLVKQGFMEKFDVKKAIAYDFFLKEPIKRLYTKLALECLPNDIDGCSRRMGPRWGVSNVMEDTQYAKDHLYTSRAR